MVTLFHHNLPQGLCIFSVVGQGRVGTIFLRLYLHSVNLQMYNYKLKTIHSRILHFQVELNSCYSNVTHERVKSN